MDGGAGSSAKGLRGAHIWKYMRGEATFAVNTFMSNAAHTITHGDGREYVHQCLSSITTLDDYQKQYISPGCAFSEREILGEITQFKVGPSKLAIHPNAAIVTQTDLDYECGRVDFEGRPKEELGSSNLNIGSTLHGVGAARARRVLRRPDARLARDVDALRPFLCDTNIEIMSRLDSGECGLGEIAQGYQLGLFTKFWPKTTSRNCTVSAFLDDALLPPSVVGPVVINFRTFPIRVNNNKYVRKSDRKILTWDEFNTTPPSDRHIIRGDSGGFYDDQRELTWEEISDYAGEPIFECTSLTKLPRRIFTFSKQNMKEALRFNNTGDDVYISVNFMNYVDSSVKGKRTKDEVLTPRVIAWLKDYILADDVKEFCALHNINLSGIFIGTWKTIDDSVFLDRKDISSL
jgi:adenylosuccinate synthase